MNSNTPPFIARALGSIPNRLQLAGGWIDQPFVSEHNPKPPGSMVVVQIEPNFRPMNRSGIASGTRDIPSHIESCNSAKVARWLSGILHLIPVEPRPEGYNPLGIKNIDSKWVARLGQSGQDCFNAIVKMDAKALGASLNLNMKCWETLLPRVVRHPLLRVDLMPLLAAYQRQYSGAMYSGCGGGYLIVVSREPVPGAFKVNVRVASKYKK